MATATPSGQNLACGARASLTDGGTPAGDLTGLTRTMAGIANDNASTLRSINEQGHIGNVSLCGKTRRGGWTTMDVIMSPDVV